MRHFLLIIGMIAVVASAHAAMYEWTDSGGGTHFTDDPDKIPVKYRKKARELNVEPVSEGKRTEQPVTVNPEKSKSLPGGHNEAWWRSSFKALREERKTIQDNLPGKREKLTALGRKRTLFHKAADRTAYNNLNDEIGKDEARVVEIQRQLADLEAEAARAGVPLEWRQ